MGTDLPEVPSDWSPDEKYLLYQVMDPENGDDLWYLRRKEARDGFDSVPFLQTSFQRGFQRSFSPQGRFVAYVSDQSGQDQVYVRPFPEGEGQWQVSAQGGRHSPRWSSDGKELFYVEADTLMAVEVSTSPSFTTGATTRLFRHPNLWGNEQRYDVSADGQRFVSWKRSKATKPKRPRFTWSRTGSPNSATGKTKRCLAGSRVGSTVR